MSADKPNETEHPEGAAPESAAPETEQPASNAAEAEQPEAEQPEPAEASADLEVELMALKAEVERLRDAALRAEAEMQNVRRRAEKDVAAAHKFGQERLLKDLLPIKDNLERALEAGAGQDEPAVQAILEGVALTDKSFADTLARHAVEIIDPQGQPFNPQEHQAMSMVENTEVPANSVLAVIQKGYRLHDRIVRPAMVMVATGGAEPAAPTQTEQD